MHQTGTEPSGLPCFPVEFIDIAAIQADAEIRPNKASDDYWEKPSHGHGRNLTTADSIRPIQAHEAKMVLLRSNIEFPVQAGAKFPAPALITGIGFLFQFGVQMNRSSGDGERLAPGCEALLLCGDLMAAGRHGDGGWRVANKCAVDLNIGAGWEGVDAQRCLGDSGRALGQSTLPGRR